MSKLITFEKLDPYVFVTKLAGFEHTNYIQGVATHTPQCSTDIPMVQGKNIRDGFFVPEHDWFIKKDVSDELPRSVLDKPCILIPYVGSNLGEVGIFPCNYKCHLASNVAKVELVSQKYSLPYLKYYLQSDIGQGYLFQNKQGSAQPNITMESIRNTSIIVRDIDEQNKICRILTALDQKYLTNLNICSELESMAKTLYDYWFVQFDFPDENGKPYRTSGGEMVWNDQLKREIPKGWSVTCIGNITANFDSQRIPLSQKQRDEIKGEIPYYGATGIMDYVNQHIFDGQYVLIAEDGSVMDSDGSPIVQLIWDKAWVNNHAHVLQGINGYSNELLYFVLKGIPVVKIMTGSIQKKINQDNLNTYLIPEIPNQLKEAYYDIAKGIFEKIHQIDSENRELTKLRDWLLAMLMNGQATVE